MPNANVQQTIDDMTQCQTVFDSALAFINSVPGLISTAVAAAVANGATEAELAPFTQLNADLSAKRDAVQAALLANTPTPTPTAARKR